MKLDWLGKLTAQFMCSVWFQVCCGALSKLEPDSRLSRAFELALSDTCFDASCFLQKRGLTVAFKFVFAMFDGRKLKKITKKTKK